MVSPGLVADLADQAELLHEEGAGALAFQWEGGTTEQRADVIDAWSQVAGELRARGWPVVEVGVEREPGGVERFAVRIQTDD